MDQSEATVKQIRLSGFLDQQQLDGVLLWGRNNFAWITGGCDNHIANFLPVGVAAIWATHDRKVCFTNTIEGPRFRHEELVGTGIDVVEYPWHDRAAGAKVLKELIGNARAATDDDDFGLGLAKLPASFTQLRWQLTPHEVARYREGGIAAAAAIEAACRALKPGMTEHEVAGVLDFEVHARGSNPVVTLVAADERLERFRHPIPTNHKLQKKVMLVTCAERYGLISNVTRIVHFGPIDESTKAKIQAVANIDTAVNLATKPGRTLAEVFADLTQAYAAEGHADQWKLHHQGGSTGYNGREVFATPFAAERVLESQGFAWNPSVVGCKSEDTVLVTAGGIEVLTRHSNEWPTVTGTYQGKSLDRAAWLEV
jgi:Xaa-Pro aminopeptidase